MKLWAVFLNEFKIFVRDRGSLIQYFIIPILIITLANFAMKDVYGGGGVVRLPVVDEDQSATSRRVVEEIKKSGFFTVEETWQDKNGELPLTASRVRRLIAEEHARSVAVVIPKGFEGKLTALEKVTLVVYQNPTEKLGPVIVKSVMALIASRLSGVSFAVALVDRETKIKAANPVFYQRVLQESQALWAAPPVAVDTQDVIHLVGNKMDAMKQNVPGFAVMFALFSMVWGCLAIISERERGTLVRLLSAPVSKAEILAGKLLMTFCVACFQLTTFFAFGHFVFGMNLGNSLAGLVLVSVVLAVTTTSMGIFIAAVTKTMAQAAGWSSLLIMVMSALGGSWWPAEFMPKYMQKFAHLVTINAWAMDGYKAILWYGQGVSAILPSMGMMLGVAAVAFFFGVWKLKLD